MRARRRLLASAALVERARHARAAAALGGRVRYASAVPRVPQGGGLRLEFGATCTPHPSKVDKGGEDAYFADGSIGAFGVSDGVGGSADARTDPGLFSRTLLRHCHAQLASAGGVADDPDGLAAAVRHAASEFRRESVGGAATLAIGGLAPSGTLNVLNVGDSQTLLLRPRPRLFESRQRLWPRLVLLSHQSTHYFNCPYQMSADTVEHALENESDMLSASATRGDVVVAATDGVFDNLFTEQAPMQPRCGRDTRPLVRDACAAWHRRCRHSSDVTLALSTRPIAVSAPPLSACSPPTSQSTRCVSDHWRMTRRQSHHSQ